MSKSLYIAEKPSVAQQFADALKIRGRRGDGYIESEDAIVGQKGNENRAPVRTGKT